MNKILTKHIFKEEDISNGTETANLTGKGPAKQSTKPKSEPVVRELSSDDEQESLVSALTSTPPVKLESRATEPLYDSELSESEA